METLAALGEERRAGVGDVLYQVGALAAFVVIAELIEAGTTRRQQYRVARLSELRGPGHRRGKICNHFDAHGAAHHGVSR